jgi:hypothetical protein
MAEASEQALSVSPQNSFASQKFHREKVSARLA